MPSKHVARAGECVSSIAFDNGFFVDTIWNHAANSSLRELRQDPNTLVPGDIVIVPDKREKEEPAETGLVHGFKLRGVPAICRIQLFDGDESPRANQDFKLIVDGRPISGKTDGAGILEVNIPPNAKRGLLTIGPDNATFELDFGHLQPADETEGVKARLNNVGFDCGEVNDEINEDLETALRQFQQRYGLEVTGQTNKATIDKLTEVHDQLESAGGAPGTGGSRT